MLVNDENICFGVFFTQKGIRCISGKIGMETMRLLKDHDCTLASLSRKMVLPISTLLFNMNKLEKSGLIRSYKDDLDRRKVYYTSMSMMIFSSMSPNPDYQKVLEKCLDREFDDKRDRYKDLLEFVISSIIKTGIDFTPLLERGGFLIGKSMKDKMGDRNIPEAIEFIQEYFEPYNIFTIELVSMDPLSIRIRVDDMMLECISLVSKPIIGTVLSIVENCTEKPHYIESKTRENDNSVVITLKSKDTKTRPGCNMYLENGLLKTSDAHVDDFVILLDKNKNPRMIDNPSQIKIIKALDNSPDSLKGLRERIGGSQSTLFSNLNKLEKNEIIYANRSSPGSNIYRNYCSEMVFIENKIQLDMKKIIFVINKPATDPGTYCKSIVEYLLLTLEAMSIDTGKIHNYIGHIYAKHLLKHYKSTSTDKLLKIVCESEPSDFTLNLESYVPLTFTVKSRLLTDVGSKAMMQFYIGEIVEIIKSKTGKTYVHTDLTDVNKEKGKKGPYRFILEPESNLQDFYQRSED